MCIYIYIFIFYINTSCWEYLLHFNLQQYCIFCLVNNHFVIVIDLKCRLWCLFQLYLEAEGSQMKVSVCCSSCFVFVVVFPRIQCLCPRWFWETRPTRHQALSHRDSVRPALTDRVDYRDVWCSSISSSLSFQQRRPRNRYL